MLTTFKVRPAFMFQIGHFSKVGKPFINQAYLTLFKHWKFGRPNNHKNLKSSVFVGIYKYLVVFGFVIFRLPKHLVFFDLLILVFKVFEKIWIWYFIMMVKLTFWVWIILMMTKWILLKTLIILTDLLVDESHHCLENKIYLVK